MVPLILVLMAGFGQSPGFVVVKGYVLVARVFMNASTHGRFNVFK
jgi:hypothetical protein